MEGRFAMKAGMQKNKMVLLGAAILCAVLLGWRFYSCSINQVLSTSKASVDSLACNATVMGVEDGELFMNTYMLPNTVKGDADFEAVMNILSNTEYRRDFRNLLPWEIDTVDDDGTHDGKSANVLLLWEDLEHEPCYIMFHSDRVIAVDTGSGGFLIYHPTNRGVLDELTEYIQTHGVVSGDQVETAGCSHWNDLPRGTGAETNL